MVNIEYFLNFLVNHEAKENTANRMFYYIIWIN